MYQHKHKYSSKFKLYIILTLTLFTGTMLMSSNASGEVKPITKAQEKLEGITEEEQETLEKLFTLTQEIEEMEREEERLTGEIDELQTGIKELDKLVEKEQAEYDTQLHILERVLVSYQRGGPASYLDIILQAENLSEFLKSINLIKDISKNTGELLASIEQSKQKLNEEKDRLFHSKRLLETKREELKIPMENKQKLKEEQDTYLKELAQEKVKYQEHLDDLKLMWNDLKEIFGGIVEEFSKIIGGGYFTLEDLNVKFSLFSVKGSIHEDTFNRILKEHSSLPEIVFHFDEDTAIIEVPDKHLVLEGSFILQGDSAILFEPSGGSFYGMALEKESIAELFREGPLLIDFEDVAGDMVLIDIVLEDIETKNGNLNFTIDTGFPF